MPREEIQVDDQPRFVEEQVEILERGVKKLKQNTIPIVKVRWNSCLGPEYTWKRRDKMWLKYPHLFSEPEPEHRSDTKHKAARSK